MASGSIDGGEEQNGFLALRAFEKMIPTLISLPPYILLI